MSTSKMKKLNRLQCCVCKRRFVNNTALSHHIRSHGICLPAPPSLSTSGLPESNDLAYSCKLCPHKFASNKALLNHGRKHKLHCVQGEFSPSLKCNLCGVDFESKFGLKVHLQSHERKSGCSTSLRPATSLLTSPSKLVLSKCIECLKLFGCPATLFKHRLTHLGTELYNCKDCGIRFLQRDLRQKHLMAHRQNLAHCCKRCTASYSTKKELEMHVSMHNNQNAMFVICGKCKLAFASRAVLMAHISARHSGKLQFECRTCQSQFNANSHLQQHIRLHERQKSAQKSECNESETPLIGVVNAPSVVDNEGVPSSVEGKQAPLLMGGEVPSLMENKQAHTLIDDGGLPLLIKKKQLSSLVDDGLQPIIKNKHALSLMEDEEAISLMENKEAVSLVENEEAVSLTEDEAISLMENKEALSLMEDEEVLSLMEEEEELSLVKDEEEEISLIENGLPSVMENKEAISLMENGLHSSVEHKQAPSLMDEKEGPSLMEKKLDCSVLKDDIEGRTTTSYTVDSRRGSNISIADDYSVAINNINSGISKGSDTNTCLTGTGDITTAANAIINTSNNNSISVSCSSTNTTVTTMTSISSTTTSSTTNITDSTMNIAINRSLDCILCDICGQTFSLFWCLKLHMQYSHYKFYCDVCYTFFDETFLSSNSKTLCKAICQACDPPMSSDDPLAGSTESTGLSSIDKLTEEFLHHLMDEELLKTIGFMEMPLDQKLEVVLDLCDGSSVKSDAGTIVDRLYENIKSLFILCIGEDSTSFLLQCNTLQELLHNMVESLRSS